MSKPLRVLIVEDSEIDALLIVHQLEEGGFEPIFERVDNAAAMTAALESKTWDVILSDYSMPQFNGMEALAICQQKGLHIPFIVVSGRIGEETAIEAMKAGAHDYVMKDMLARLAPAVERELNAAEERKARRRAEAAMAHLAAIVETCDDAIISESPDGRILSWNAGAERMYGYRAEEIIGKPISSLIPMEQSAQAVETHRPLRWDRDTERTETVRLRKDGSRVDVALTVSPIRGADGRIRATSIVARDIAARKRQERERLALIEELTDALARVKTLSGLLPICASCKKIRNDHGYWEQVETYLKNRADIEFTHGICPDCSKRLYPELCREKDEENGHK